MNFRAFVAQGGVCRRRDELWRAGLLALAVFCLAAPVLSAQNGDVRSTSDSLRTEGLDWKRYLAGSYAGYGINSLSGLLSSNELPGAIPGNGECGSFETGSGHGPLFGLLGEYRFSDVVAAALRIEYTDRSGALRYNCVDPAQIRMPDGSLVAAETEHTAELSLGTLALHPGIAVRPFDIPLVITPGASVYVGFGGDYELREEVVSPGTAEFVTGGQSRTYGGGNLTDGGNAGGFGVGAFAAIGYELPAGSDWTLRPELSFSMPLTDDYSLGGIRSTGLRLTLGLNRAFGTVLPEPSNPLDPLSEISPQKHSVPFGPVRTPDMGMVLESDNGPGWGRSRLEIRRVIAAKTRLIPLLPYLFFDNRVGTLPVTRYTRLAGGSIDTFSEEALRSSSTLDVYSHLLNIVGLRMRRYPDAVLTLIGTAPDMTEGPAASELARMRAEEIRDYLAQTWGIESERLKIVTQYSPAVPTNPETPEGRSENRRVELSANRPEIFQPLLFTDTTDVEMTGEARLSLAGPAMTNVRAWKVIATNSYNRPRVDVASGTGTPPSEIVVELPPLGGPDGLDTLVVDLELVMNDASTATITDRLPVRRDDTYRQVIATGEYSLILFDAAKSGLRKEHLEILDTIVRLLPENAKVTVDGYTDFLGDSVANRELSEQRAYRVAEELQGKVHNLWAEGKGEDLESFTVQGVPEERMYSRRVVIRVSDE